MQTLAQTATPRKPAKAYYATLYEDHGVLAQLDDGVIYFLNDVTDTLMVLEPQMCPWVTILGDVGLADLAVALDARRGGAAKIACTRAQGVA
jgi:hypothetical protein